MVKSIADLQLRGFFGKGIGETLINRFLDKEPRRRNTDLPRVARLDRDGCRGGRDRIDVVADNDRRVTSELHDRRFHVTPGHFGKGLADRDRAGERNQADG